MPVLLVGLSSCVFTKPLEGNRHNHDRLWTKHRKVEWHDHFLGYATPVLVSSLFSTAERRISGAQNSNSFGLWLCSGCLARSLFEERWRKKLYNRPTAFLPRTKEQDVGKAAAAQFHRKMGEHCANFFCQLDTHTVQCAAHWCRIFWNERFCVLCFEICPPSLFPPSPPWSVNFKIKQAQNLSYRNNPYRCAFQSGLAETCVTPVSPPSVSPSSCACVALSLPFWRVVFIRRWLVHHILTFTRPKLSWSGSWM